MFKSIRGYKTYAVMFATWASIGFSVYTGTIDLAAGVTAAIAATGLGTIRSAI